MHAAVTESYPTWHALGEEAARYMDAHPYKIVAILFIISLIGLAVGVSEPKKP